MSDPQRWLDKGGASLEVALLRAARADAPPDGAKDKLLEALGIAAGAAERAETVRASDASRAHSAAEGALHGGAPPRRLSRPSARLAPAARAVLFECVLGGGESRAGLFGPGGAVLPVVAAVAAAATLWLVVPLQRSKPARFNAIEVVEMSAPVPQARRSRENGSLDAPAEPPVRSAHASGATPARPHGAPHAQAPSGAAASPEGPAIEQNHVTASGAALADATDTERAPAAALADATDTERAPAAALADEMDTRAMSEPAEVAHTLSPPATPPASTQAALSFGTGMTRPVLLSGRDPVYTREALSARVEGTVMVKCTITPLGTLTHCRIQQSVPWMDQAVLEAMATRRYRPVTYQGRPISVDYVFTIRLVLPK